MGLQTTLTLALEPGSTPSSRTDVPRVGIGISYRTHSWGRKRTLKALSPRWRSTSTVASAGIALLVIMDGGCLDLDLKNGLRCSPQGHCPSPYVCSMGMAGGVCVLDRGAPTLSLLAGRLGGPGNLDGTGTAARFNSPTEIASDGEGNLFVADSGNNTIRWVVIATGAVTTLAGTPGLSGRADGIGAAASFNNPEGIASDGFGNLFVADWDDIRQVEIATGGVTTLAGTPGSPGSADGTGAFAANFNSPQGIASDGVGNLIVADSGNNTIRRVVIATAAVTTLAGQGGSIRQHGRVRGRRALQLPRRYRDRRLGQPFHRRHKQQHDSRGGHLGRPQDSNAACGFSDYAGGFRGNT